MENLQLADRPVRTGCAVNALVAQAELTGDIDYNNLIRAFIIAGIRMIPTVGGILSGVTGALWPETKENVWKEIRDKVEALIDEKIAERTWDSLEDDLTGLQDNINEFLNAAKNYPDDPKYISEKFNVAEGLLIKDRPAFQTSKYQLLLLPLFAQFANLHLSLLRNGALFGANWGWSPEIVNDMKKKLTDKIEEYSAYAQDVYDTGLAETKRNAPKNKHKTQPFNTVNKFERNMTLTVLDFKTLWPYFDVTKYPEPVDVWLDREIYSQAVGTSDDTPFRLPKEAPTEPIETISVWGWDRIDAIKVDYPQGGGPDGSTTTGRMGNSSGGSNTPPHGGVFNIKDTGPVVLVRVGSGSIIDALWFQFRDGTWTNKLGGNYSTGNKRDFSYSDEILSSIRIMGKSSYYGSANCAVFGFKFDRDAALRAPDLIRMSYVTSVEDTDVTSLAERFDLSDAQREDILKWADAHGWEDQRREFWDNIAARTKARVGH